MSDEYIYIYIVGRVFTNGPRDQGSISGQVIPKTLKMVLATSLHNTQHYKVHIKGKVEQSRGRSSAQYLPLTLTRQGSTQGQWSEGRLEWGLGEGKIAYEPRFKPSWSMLLIDSLGTM